MLEPADLACNHVLAAISGSFGPKPNSRSLMRATLNDILLPGRGGKRDAGVVRL